MISILNKKINILLDIIAISDSEDCVTYATADIIKEKDVYKKN